MADLKLDWATHSAAKFAVENWHYSKRLPVGRLVNVGVWENSRFIGAVIFGRGANQSMGSQFGLAQTECVELVRVALSAHKSPVSRIVAIAIRFLKKSNQGLRLIVSYADPAEGHVGGIYKAGNWIYTGVTSPGVQYWHDGRWKHSREVTSGAFGKSRKVSDVSSLVKRVTPGKHRYLMPLDELMKDSLVTIKKPYPKKSCATAVVDGASCPG